MSSDDSVPGEVHRQVCAERDAFRDLLERAVIAAAVFRYGPMCSGKMVQLGAYKFRVVMTAGVHQALLVPEVPDVG